MLELPNSPFRRVTLPLCGLELDIRRVDVKTLGMDAMTYVSRSGLLGEAKPTRRRGRHRPGPAARPSRAPNRRRATATCRAAPRSGPNSCA